MCSAAACWYSDMAGGRLGMLARKRDKNFQRRKRIETFPLRRIMSTTKEGELARIGVAWPGLHVGGKKNKENRLRRWTMDCFGRSLNLDPEGIFIFLSLLLAMISSHILAIFLPFFSVHASAHHTCGRTARIRPRLTIVLCFLVMSLPIISSSLESTFNNTHRIASHRI